MTPAGLVKALAATAARGGGGTRRDATGHSTRITAFPQAPGGQPGQRSRQGSAASLAAQADRTRASA